MTADFTVEGADTVEVVVAVVGALVDRDELDVSPTGLGPLVLPLRALAALRYWGGV